MVDRIAGDPVMTVAGLAAAECLPAGCPLPEHWRRWWRPKLSATRRRREQRRRRRAWREAERASGRHGMRFVGEAGPDVRADAWTSRDTPPWEDRT